MNIKNNSWFDVTVECNNCHDLYYCEMQLDSQRDIATVNEVLKKLFTRCHNCGADGKEFFITVYEATHTTEETKHLDDKKGNESNPLIDIVE